MPKPIDAAALDRLVEYLGRHAGGAGIDMLLRATRGKTSRRTLQRRLAALVQAGRVKTEGAGRARVYRAANVVSDARSVGTATAEGVKASIETYVWVSPAGAEIQRHISQPLQARRPIGYESEFLEAYEPNRTFYLDAATRAQLHAIGRAGTSAQAAGTFARDILQRLLIDLSWASSRLEGNTYSRLDTERLIEHGEAAAGKDAIETQMILNHKAAIEYLAHREHVAAVDEATLVALHALLSDGLLADPMAGGRLRQRTVEIGGSVYRPLGLPQRLHDEFARTVARAAAIDDAFEQAFFLLAHLPYLQPFEDVNKRVARLAANIPLMRDNLAPLSFIDVPPRAYVDAMLGVYELQRVDLLRDVFVWAYERSCQQYLAVRHDLKPPDPLRLRHRAALGEAVRALVRRMKPPTPRAVAAATPDSVPRAEREAFARLIAAELDALHEGNAIRFGLSALEAQAWLALRR